MRLYPSNMVERRCNTGRGAYSTESRLTKLKKKPEVNMKSRRILVRVRKKKFVSNSLDKELMTVKDVDDIAAS